jgi:hypothetical protein
VSTLVNLIGGLNQPVANGSTPFLNAQFVDKDGVTPIPAAVLTTLTLSIVDTGSKAIVNGVSARPILNADRGTVDNQGNLTIALQALDTALLNAADEQEFRSLVIDWTYNAGANVGRCQVNFVIAGLVGP